MRLAAFTLVLAFAAFLVHGAASSILSGPAAKLAPVACTAGSSLSSVAVRASIACI